VTDFLNQKRTEITQRLRELEPLVQEFSRLQDAAAALADLGPSKSTASSSAAAAPSPTRRRPRRASTKKRPAAAKVAATPKRRGGGRPKGSGTRAAQALSMVQGQPGITIPELAAKMGIKQNYLYRVLPSLEEEGKIVKEGRGWRSKS
jgi:hypothetical protein